jgi:periplasmic divalent cation tolerance protein
MPERKSSKRKKPHKKKGTAVRVVFCTVPSEEVAFRIGRSLVEKRLSACVNVLPITRSIYFWQGKIEEEPEYLLIIKTTEEKISPLKTFLPTLHPYTVPEILILPVEDGGEKYIEWVKEVVG